MNGKMPSVESCNKEEDAQWPLPYCVKNPTAPNGVQAQWWSHSLYRGPDDKLVEVLYSKDKAHSEVLAKLFLEEPVVGFDMEWPWDSEKHTRLQQKIGLIQIASQDKIALFHIGLHAGSTSEQIIAPSLKKLIEDPTIAKIGVNVLGADFARLRRHFGLMPQGALELSHLHRLITFSKSPTQLTTKLVSLASQVQEHLGLPLSKGSVRTSNWSRPLSPQQIAYAADDAYAGFMLFHCMNGKRVSMTPVPPLPIFADKYPLKGRTSGIRLHPAVKGGDQIMAATFFKPPSPAEETADNNESTVEAATEKAEPHSQKPTKERKKKDGATKANVSAESLDATSKALFDKLSERRSAIATAQGFRAFIVASDAMLEGLARRRPLKFEELLEVKGIGPQKQEKYGYEFLEVIAHFLATNDLQTDSLASIGPLSSTSSHNPRRRKAKEESCDSSPAYGITIQHTPQLHTGLSFGLAETRLEPHGATADSNAEGSSFVSTPPSRPSPQLKRKRAESILSELRPPPAPPAEQIPPPSPQSKLFENKLVAFSKLVAAKLSPRPPNADTIVSKSTLDRIVTVAPRTWDELYRIPEVIGFARACDEAGMDLLKNIVKFAQKKV